MEIEIIEVTPPTESTSQSKFGNSTPSEKSVPESSNQLKSSPSPPIGRSSASSTRFRNGNMDYLMQQAARLGLTSDTDKFLQNFNPENSNREKRKLTRKLVQNHKRCYDAKGVLIVCNKDLCDCLNEKCPGCFFPCPKCRSCKCGHECRQFRKWVYESAEMQCSRKTIQNSFKHMLKKKP